MTAGTGKSLAGLLLALLLAVVAPCPASAHDPQMTGIRIVVRGGEVLVSINAHESRLAGAEQAILRPMTEAEMSAALRRRLRLLLDGKSFAPTRVEMRRDRAQGVILWHAAQPGVPRDLELAGRILPEDPTSRDVVTLQRGDRVTEEVVIDAAHPAHRFREHVRQSWGETVLVFLGQGLRHIFGGPDHILFIVGLVIAGGGLWPLLRIVTAFTVAHSITLSVAALGLFSPPSRIIEPLIALSLVVVAVENLRPGATRDIRPYLAFGFGLVHGFGFAGALSEIGLPTGQVAAALAAFNVGVETGQAAIVLAVAPLLARLAEKREATHGQVCMAGSLLVGAAGAYWFVSRIFGG